jgi:tetratricopeptide (TPR) repeat protein
MLSLALVLTGFQALWGSTMVYPLWSKNYSPVQQGKDLISGALSADQMLFALAGFRELIAGILWVRADSFFESGNYDAILPIIRLVTFLDPHQIDVYATGMWHIGYNFTDEEQRSDRRYLPSALALGKEGATQNPNTYELYFETAWLWYHKIDDNYEKAVQWMEKADSVGDIKLQPARRNLLSRLYERNGDVDKALNHWYTVYDIAQGEYDKDTERRNFQLHQNRDTIENNLDTLLVRMSQRGYFAETEKRSLEPYDVYPPFDVGFGAKVTVTAERVIRVQGNWDVLAIGSRIRVVLRDADYPNAIPGGANWDAESDINFDPPRDRTYMMEQCFVRNQRFDKTIDMSRDPTMYPFTKKNYVIEFYYNPRSAPEHIQDKFGWNGEGMTDRNIENMNKSIRPNTTCLFYSMPITREQILLRGAFHGTAVSMKSKGYRETESDYNIRPEMKPNSVPSSGLADGAAK